MIIVAIMFILGFILSVNSFLLGAFKSQIFVIGNVLALFLLCISCYLYNFEISCAVAFAYLCGFVFFKPLGARSAAWLLRQVFQSTGKYIGLPCRRLKKISIYIDKYIHNNDIKASTTIGVTPVDSLIGYCCSLRDIKEILKVHNVSRNDLSNLFYGLLRHGGGQWGCGHFVAASALAYPDTLTYLLIQGVSQETVFNVLMYFERGIPLGALTMNIGM